MMDAVGPVQQSGNSNVLGITITEIYTILAFLLVVMLILISVMYIRLWGSDVPLGISPTFARIG